MLAIGKDAPLLTEWLDNACTAPGSVLLHAADPGYPDGRSLLFTEPLAYITANLAEDLPSAFDQLQQSLAAGHHVAGYLTYEAGLALHGLPAHPLPLGEPLLCFGVYSAPSEHQVSPPPVAGPSDAAPLNLALLPTLSVNQYEASLAALQQWIAAGDIYQANYTFPLRGLSRHTLPTLYRALLQQQPAAFASVLNLAPPSGVTPVLLSFSPELFFRTDADGTIHTQPMKGTLARSTNPAEDNDRPALLAADPKNRAEHVMIVDLLRNDLGRICQTGSVQTHNLFAVRSLPTVHQMVTDVRGRLRPGLPWIDLFRALFPCGSVTGAPKHRALQVLHQVEREPRGAYTGAIGYIAPSGEACFSVAIRTMALRPAVGQQEVTCCVGGGIVADSTASGEYEEALLKSAFLRRAAQPLVIIETLRAERGVLRWAETHLDRLQQTAQALGFTFHRPDAFARLQHVANTLHGAQPYRLRATLSPSGKLQITSAPLSLWPNRLRIRMAQTPTRLGDPALRYKTSMREAYDSEARAAHAAGWDEALFANDAGLVTEGSVTNVFFVRGGCILTPYVECGMLPGVLRAQLLAQGLITESLLPLECLPECEALLLGNSLRGIFAVESLQRRDGQLLSWDPLQAERHLRELQQILPPGLDQ